MNRSRLKSIMMYLVWSLTISVAYAENDISIQIYGHERHVNLDWTIDPNVSFDNTLIYRAKDGGDFELIRSVGRNRRSFIDWYGEVPFGTTFSYYITTRLAGQESAPSDTLSIEIEPMSDEAYMDMVQRFTLRYFWDFGHPVSGMARERNTSGDLVTTGGTGFGIMAMLSGVERGWLSREDALNRIILIASFLQNADTYKGAFPHWMDGRTGRTIAFSEFDDGADLVETAFLMQGLLCARAFFDTDNPVETGLRQIVTSLYEAVEWNWFRRGQGNVLFWHWSPNHEWQMNLPIRGFDESKMVYLLAVASPTYPVPASLYHNGWAGGNYLNNGIHFGFPICAGPFAGGPMFFAHYSFIGFDPRDKRDEYCNYFERNRNHALIQQAYAKANPLQHKGYSDSCWGITASDNPWGYLAHDLTGTNDNGTIAPTAALSSMPYTPEASMMALKHFYHKLGDRLWGEYGFHDAFNLNEDWFATSYLAIDQGPIVCMIENHRSELLWRLFMDNPEIQPALDAIGFEEDIMTTTGGRQDLISEIQVFPTVADNVIFFKSEETKAMYDISIHDSQGRLVSHIKGPIYISANEVYEWNCSALADGLYYIIINDEKHKRYTNKIIINRN